MEFFTFPDLCMKMFLDSVVALMEAWEDLFSACCKDNTLLVFSVYTPQSVRCIGMLYCLTEKSVLVDHFLSSK